MNSNVNVALPQLPSLETWSRETEGGQLLPALNRQTGNAREMVALFPAGRFFRFPIRVRIQLAHEALPGNAGPYLNSELFHPATEPLGTGIGGLAWASIENANCVDATTSPEIFLFGDVVVDFRKMELRRGEKQIDATAQEFKTLHYFITHPEVPISRDELLNRVWGFHHYPTTRVVDNRIMQLRKKLESDPSRPAHFLTVHRVGYKFVP